MIVDDRNAETGLAVVVGPSSVEAAHVFGPLLDDAVVASYAELAEVAVPHRLTSVHLVVAPGCEQALPGLLEHLGRGLRLELAASVEHHALLERLLSEHSLHVQGVRDAGRGVVLDVVRSGADDRDRDHNRVVLQAVALAGSRRGSGTTAHERVPAPPPRPRGPRRRRETTRPARPVPLLVRQLDRLVRLVGGRRGALLLAGGLALLVLLLAVVAATGSVAASTLLLLLLGGTSAAAAATAVVAVLLLSRQVHRQTARVERLVQAHEESLHTQGRRQARREAAAARQTELTHDYLDALATATAVQGRDLHLALEDLAAEQRHH